MADSLPTPADSPAPLTPSSDHLAQGIRFLSLHKYAQASETLTYAVETLIEKNGELNIDNVDALVLCGKALLGNAIEQSAVLGGNAPTNSNALPDSVKPDGATTASGSTSGSSSTNANATAGPSNSAFHFGGDGEEEEDDEEGEGEGEGEGQDGEGGEGEKEDDFESAFIMLDLARRTVEVELERLEKEKKKEEQEEKVWRGRKEKLAEIHRLLGDVATESEQFDSAVEEYSSSLSILSKILPASDRQLSEQHMLIALASEFLPGTGLGRAVSHAEKAKSVLVLKLSELEAKDEGEKTEKDKKEIENIRELLGDVDNKIEDLKTVPTEPEPSAADKALEDFLRQATGVSGSSAPVNDLNSLVKKKKKPSNIAAPAAVKKEEAPIEAAEEDGKGKRKAEEEVGKEESEEKKVKIL